MFVGPSCPSFNGYVQTESSDKINHVYNQDQFAYPSAPSHQKMLNGQISIRRRPDASIHVNSLINELIQELLVIKRHPLGYKTRYSSSWLTTIDSPHVNLL